MAEKIYKQPTMRDMNIYRIQVIAILSFIVSLIFLLEMNYVIKIGFCVGMIATANIWCLLEFVFYFKKRKQEDRFFMEFLALVGIVFLQILVFAVIHQSNGLEGLDNRAANFLDYLYFSIVTWTTLGYGDLHPSEAGRLFAAFQALLGYVYTALLVGLFIAMVHERSDHDTKDSESPS